MFLKELQVEGFKSIATYTAVDLINDVNVIMGPNGSGKSNFFECIQWVLGGISAKQLRASNMEEVIFDGGENGKPALFAKGTLIFDNTDRAIDIAVDSVAITRKLTRGKGNEYFVNDESIKLKDLTKLFTNKGIGKNNYAITGQNRITEFILMKPDEIRGVIEESAGIAGFKSKKNELLSSIENYDRDIDRVDAVLSEMLRSIRPLQKQIKNIEIHNVLKKELDERRLYHYSSKLETLSDEINSLIKEETSLNLNKSVLVEEKTTIDTFISNYNYKNSELSSKLNILEDKLSKLETELSNVEKEKLMSTNTIDNLLEKREAMNANVKILEDSSNVEEDEKKKLFLKINEIGKSITTDENVLSNLDSDIEINKEAIDTLEHEIENSIIDVATEKSKIDILEKDINIAEEHKATLNFNYKNLEKTALELSDNLTLIKKEIDMNTLLNEELSNSIQHLNSIESKLKTIENNIRVVDKSNSRLRKTISIKEKIQNVPGFIGILNELVSFDDKYTIAVGALFGNTLLNFVVENTTAANQCISILKKNKIPPLNFIILSKISHKKKNYPIPDNLTPSKSIFQADVVYQKLIDEYLNNSFIADTSAIAESEWNKSNQKLKIVTLDGILYNSNIVRGGYIPKDISKLKKELALLTDQKHQLLTYEKTTFESVHELKAKRDVLTHKNTTTTELYNTKQLEIRKLSDELNEVNHQIIECTTQIADVYSNIDETKNLIEEKTKDIAINKQTLSNLKDTLKQNGISKETLIIELASKTAILDESEKKYYVYKNNSNEQIESLKENIKIVLEQINLERTNYQSLDSLLKNLHNRYEPLKADLNTTKAELSNLRNNNDHYSRRLNELISEIAIIDNSLTKITFKKDKLLEHINISKMRIDEVTKDTQLVNFNESSSEMINKINSLEKRIQNLGFINIDALDEFNELNKRYTHLCTNKQDLEASKSKIVTLLNTMQEDMTEKFMKCYSCLQQDFTKIFTKLFNGGSAELLLENADDPLSSGVIIKATPPGKKNKPISLLSGGEKSLAAVSFIFSLLKFSPSPLVVFDEIDAALDEINVSLLADYINTNKNVQYIIVSHRKPMMKVAKALYGASMIKGVTELISQKL